MILKLAQGMTVEVLEGRLWITQTGRTQDLILGRGARYSAESDGVVLVGLDEPVRIDLRAGARPTLWRRLRQAWEAREAARELAALPDHRLRDLGISRDQIRHVV
jgi:uncharacterized protein YjiS (DUF1127 family)